MANLPESSSFDAGVYQLETTDPVIGGPSGVSNAPLKNLANRTRYLKDQVDALASSKAPLASPAFTGAPTAPTAAQGTNTTQLATTAFVNAEIAADMAANLATVAPAANGAAAVGTSTKMAREDHVHPTDTTRAPLASPAFTGTPTAPTPANGTNNTQLATTAFVKNAMDTFQGEQPGQVVFFATNSAPTGWLKANGAAVSRATYAALFAVIGTTFGAGDGSSTFNLPDLRGEFLRGWDDARGVDGGRGFGSAQADAFQGHYHSSYPVCGAAGVTGDQRPTVGSGTGSPTDRFAMEPTAGSNGTPRTANETRPRNIALLACIKF